MYRDVNLMEYLPTHFHDYIDLDAMHKTMGMELQELVNGTEVLMNNQFVNTTDVTGIGRYEILLGIQHFDSDTLDDRRFRVLSVWNKYVPYTKNTLIRKLEAMCGSGNFRIWIKDRIISVRVALKSRRSFYDVESLLEGLVPCNMLIDLTLLYVNHQDLQVCTHEKMYGHTHEDIRNGGVTEWLRKQ